MKKTTESDKFWEDIIYKKGKLDEKQVLKELSDFYYIMEQVPKVYDEITGGALSKLMYPAETVLGIFEDLHYDKKIIQDDMREIVNNLNLDLKELKKELRDYFEL